LYCCVDVDYRERAVVAACVGFQGWAAPAPRLERVVVTPGAAPEYEPGAFYRRELGYLLSVLAALPEPPELIVVDGFVWLGAERPGLGAHLHAALLGRSAVVGVAKRPYHGALGIPVQRGHSAQPLYVTAIGVPLDEAAAGVRAMHGPHRIPTLLKRVDRLCRDTPAPAGG
jgi:deoxyribonuclease V